MPEQQIPVPWNTGRRFRGEGDHHPLEWQQFSATARASVKHTLSVMAAVSVFQADIEGRGFAASLRRVTMDSPDELPPISP